MRRALLLGCVPILIAICAGRLSTGRAAGSRLQADKAIASPGSRLQANKAIASRDARALLEHLKLPAAITRPRSRPPLSALVPPRVRALNTLGESEWWTTSATPDAVIAYVRAHRPHARGNYQLMTVPPSSETFIWTIDGVHLYSQTLEVTAATLADGRTGVMAEAQSTWMVPRPLSERVPTGVRSVAITLRIGTGEGGFTREHSRTYTFARANEVTSIVNAFDAMPTLQPGVAWSCPLFRNDAPRLTLRFLISHGSSAVARASVQVYPGRNGYSGTNPCDAIDFWIGRREETSLTSHTFVGRIAKLIGADIS